jgi:aldehyde dehydrogenase (NAD+)
MSDNIKNLLEKQRDYFSKGETKNITFRLNALKILKAAIKEKEKDIMDALHKDLNKAPFEAYATEVGFIYNELNDAIKNIRKWSKVKRVRTPVTQFKSTSYIVSEPYGNVLIMSPWNYPFQLTIAPLIGAIAGGNCAVVKPSAYSPCTSSVINRIISSCFDKEYIAVIEGGREANQELLHEKFDYIFFTGSVGVGKTVMEAASKNLTPVTLELGGKSPCIVDKDVNIDITARRIVWGKTINSGQTCVAPDYIYVHKDVKDDLLSAMKKYIIKFYGEQPCKNPDFPRIVNGKHFKRLIGLIDNEKVYTGGDFDESNLKISPTILENVVWEDPVMQEEIFGPILPILTFSELNEVISAVNSRPKPLALYLFTKNREVEEKIINSISFGGGCINDTIVHLATSYMPFGGVGESGMGSYHSKWSFDTFTHKKSIMKKLFSIDIKLRYPPYKDKLGVLKRIMK